MDTNIPNIELLLSQGTTVEITPQGFSMYPLIYPKRDSVIIAPVDYDTLKRGDVALYRRTNSILVLHRIYRCNDHGYYFVGDNQSEIEGPLDAAQIKGVMSAVIRKNHYVSVKNPIYKFYSVLWLWLRPIRPIISKTIAGLKKMLHRSYI